MKKLFLSLFIALTSIQNSYAQDVPPSFCKAVECFQQNQGNWITSHCQAIQMGECHYYGVRTDEQMQKHGDPLLTRRLYREMKQKVLQTMGLPLDTEVVQVVGDSAPFSVQGTLRAKEFLRVQLPPQAVVLYGYTGHAAADGTRCTNAAVSDTLEERGLLCKAIGVLVGFHTPLALKKWGCTGPKLQHYIIVYGDDETCRERGTIFGDDVTTSDFFADRLLVLDGGVQSFRQICNALLLDQKVDLLIGLRTPEKSQIADKQGNKTTYFAAAKFLRDLASFIEKKGSSLSEADLQQWYRDYFGPGKCSIAGPQAPDVGAKQKQLDEAWALLIEERLDRKIAHLVREH